MARRFSVEGQFRAIDQVTKPIDRMQRRISKFTRITGKSFDRLNKKIGDFSAKALSAGAAMSLGAVSLALADGTRRAIEFEQTLVNAAAKFPEGIKKGSKAFLELEKAARKTGAATEFSASQSAEALNFLAMAGFNAKQSIAALPGVVDLATAAQIDLAQATDIASDTLGAFGLATKDPLKLSANLARVNDVLAKTVTTANTDMELLFETIKEGGPVAKSAGASMETYAALAGKLANAGIKGSAAGTTLKNVFLSLSAVTPKAAKALAKLGVTTKDEQGNLRDVIDIFGDINKGIQKEKLGTADTAAVLKDIFGRIPIAGVNVLLNEGSESLRKYRKQLEGATGASGAMAAQMRDTLKGQINSLLSAFEGLQITIFKLNGGALAQFIEKITNVIRTVDEAIQKNQELGKGIVSDVIDTLVGVVQIIGLVIAAFTAWKLVILATQLANIAMFGTLLILKGALMLFKGLLVALKVAQIAWNLAMTLNPIGLIITAIAALIIAGGLLLEYWDPISAFFVDMWAKIASVFEVGIDFVMILIKPFLRTIAGIGGLFEKFGIVFGGKEEDEQKAGESQSQNSGSGISPQVVTQSQSLQRTVEESRQQSSAELLIRDETGRGELSSKSTAPGVKISMAQSGGI